MFFSSLQRPSAVVSVHPQTTNIVLREGHTPANLLVGYVSVVVERPTAFNGITARLHGEQKLSWRQGNGPSSAVYSVAKCCADIQQTLVDMSTATYADIEMARLDLDTATADSKSSATADSAHAGNAASASALQNSSALTLLPGEYRFSFEFSLASNLPPSLCASHGCVKYRLSASLRRPWFQPDVCSCSVPISIIQCPAPTLSLPNALLGYPTLQALTSAPLLLQSPIGDSWKISVYSASRALFLGWPIKLQVCASLSTATAAAATATTTTTASNEDEQLEGGLELVEFAVSLTEIITHKIPAHGVAKTTRAKVADSAICPLLAAASAKKESITLHHQSIDPQIIDALGDSLDDLPNARSLLLPLPPSGKSRIQTDSNSQLFSVAHELSVAVIVRELNGSCKYHRVAFNFPVLVLPESLCEHGTVKSLPCYAEIARDVVLDTSVNTLQGNPPSYFSLST
ncbi:hypothetical protein GGI12_004320 [Dipsacomyces acuminosporus]|nr:hypothetical protein GGI12_004320 [Dipsacomyces acuminosporus]